MHQTAVTAAGELHCINSADQEEQRVCKTESCKADDMAIHCEADAMDFDDQEDEQDTNCECADACCKLHVQAVMCYCQFVLELARPRGLQLDYH